MFALLNTYALTHEERTEMLQGQENEQTQVQVRQQEQGYIAKYVPSYHYVSQTLVNTSCEE